MRPLRPILFLFLAGCGGGLAVPTFDWGLSSSSLAALATRPEDQARVAQILTEHFGTPALPDAKPLTDGTDPDALGPALLSPTLRRAIEVDNRRRFIDELEALDSTDPLELDLPAAVADLRRTWSESGLEGEALAEQARTDLVEWLPDPTRRSSLFARTCLTCHGPEGGGNGPSASALSANPPRDFRSGEFVHFADHERARPSRDELVELLYEGVAGTPMSSFKSLPSSELVGLAEHVRLLSVRGALERALVAELEAGGELASARIATLYDEAWSPWLEPVNDPSILAEQEIR
ncbi:MAG: c-type cytochrome [Planctomycetota bacterium]